MRLRFVGLDRMGSNMARRLMVGGHQIVAWDQRAGRQWRPSQS